MMPDLAHLWVREGLADLRKHARRIETAAAGCREGGNYRLTMEAVARCYRAAETAFKAQAAIELRDVPEPPKKVAIVAPPVTVPRPAFDTDDMDVPF